MVDDAGTTTCERSREIRFRDALLFAAPLLVLALGHMLSNILRTLPAIASDVLSADIATSQENLASLAGAYHFAFAAGQVPVGVALDRYGVRTVSLILLSIVAGGAVLAANVGGAAGFLIAQAILGIGCCGLLLCPMTLAAKLLTPSQFGLWSGIIQGVGNAGMLLSASPMAWLVEEHGWRAGYWVSAILAVFVVLLVSIFVPNNIGARAASQTTLGAEARAVVQIGLSNRLRAVMILAFTTFAAAIAVRGLWGGPWLMEIKNLSRIDAGNALLPMTLALVIGPIAYGFLDRRVGHRRELLMFSHMVAGGALLLLAAGAPGGLISRATHTEVVPTSFDVWMLFIFGASIAVQPLIFAMARAAVPPENAGKALAAVNLSFFAGAAIIQALTSPVGAMWGMPAVMVFLGLVVLVATATFTFLTRRG